jgi:hypothetical protein
MPAGYRATEEPWLLANFSRSITQIRGSMSSEIYTLLGRRGGDLLYIGVFAHQGSTLRAGDLPISRAPSEGNAGITANPTQGSRDRRCGSLLPPPRDLMDELLNRRRRAGLRPDSGSRPIGEFRGLYQAQQTQALGASDTRRRGRRLPRSLPWRELKPTQGGLIRPIPTPPRDLMNRPRPEDLPHQLFPCHVLHHGDLIVWERVEIVKEGNCHT